MAKKLILFLLIAAIYVAHQDNWNWTETSPLALGFLPIGLGYHAAYSIACAVLMAILVRSAWPSHLESVEPRETAARPQDEESHS